MNWAELMAQVPAPATVSVEAYAGAAGTGRLYSAAVEVEPCVVEAARRQVTVTTQDASGKNVVSSTTVYCPPGTVAPPLSRVTLPSGEVTTVLERQVWDDHGLELPSHVELLCE